MAEEEKSEDKKMKNNPMRDIEIEKIVLNCGAVEDELDKSARLLNLISKKKVKMVASTKRIPSFGVRPGLKTGCMVTIRGKEKEELLKNLLIAIDNKIKKKQIVENNFSFGVPEYLEIPGMEYQRDIGILGFDVTVVFKRKGKRVGIKKIKRGKIPKKQRISKQEIIEILKNKFGVEAEGK
jgi:large subunit ribosomal protein L5